MTAVYLSWLEHRANNANAQGSSLKSTLVVFKSTKTIFGDPKFPWSEITHSRPEMTHQKPETTNREPENKKTTLAVSKELETVLDVSQIAKSEMSHQKF